MIVKTQRAQSVRPHNDKSIQPLHGKDGTYEDEGTEKVEEDGDVVPKEDWEQLNNKVEELTEKVAIHFEDKNRNDGRGPIIVKAPPQPTKEEVEQHQATHTPYAAWCKHCVKARAVRRQHPHKGRGAMIAPEVDSDTNGPIKVSLDYMYLHERAGNYRETIHNSPHLVMIEHRHGRCWAYEVPNTGVHEKASC